MKDREEKEGKNFECLILLCALNNKCTEIILSVVFNRMSFIYKPITWEQSFSILFIPFLPCILYSTCAISSGFFSAMWKSLCRREEIYLPFALQSICYNLLLALFSQGSVLEKWPSHKYPFFPRSVQFIGQSCPIICNPMDSSMPGVLVDHQLQFTQTRVHCVGDAV